MSRPIILMAVNTRSTNTSTKNCSENRKEIGFEQIRYCSFPATIDSTIDSLQSTVNYRSLFLTPRAVVAEKESSWGVEERAGKESGREEEDHWWTLWEAKDHWRCKWRWEVSRVKQHVALGYGGVMKTGIMCNMSRSKEHRPSGVLTEIGTAGMLKTQNILN